MAYLEYFDPRMLALQEEVSHHPQLMGLLAKHPPQEMEMRIAEIAAYCEVILDGYYTQEELAQLADILTRKLKQKNCIVLLPQNY